MHVELCDARIETAIKFSHAIDVDSRQRERERAQSRLQEKDSKRCIPFQSASQMLTKHVDSSYIGRPKTRNGY